MCGAEAGNGSVEIADAVTDADIAEAARLFRAYAASLSVDLCFQNFATELEGLPGAYTPPGGRLLLARADGQALGCVAMKALGEADAEMKRLYVSPAARGRGVGLRLVEAVLASARSYGYRRLFLDTLPEMAEAHKLYQRLGFLETDPYVHNPVHGARYMVLALA